VTEGDRSSDPVAFMALGPDGTVLRTSRGDCSTGNPPTITVVPRLGARHVTTRLPRLARLPRLREVVGVAAIADHGFEVVGLSKKCRPVVYTSTDRGGSWSRRPGESGTWHLAADRTAPLVVTPDGDRSAPCVPRSVSGVDALLARLLCDDGRIFGTDDAGSSWILLGRLHGAVDVRFTDAARGLAVARRKSCPAAVMESLDGGLGWARIACLPGRRPRTIDVRGELVAVQIGARLRVSSDGGTTWPEAHG
jgi:hypothetical protein